MVMVGLSAAVLMVRVAVGSLLILAGSLKLSTGTSPRHRWLEAYDLLPTKLLPAAGVAIPIAELIGGVSLFLGAFGGLGAFTAAAVLGVVTAAAASALLRGKRPPCGCLGRMSRELLSWRIVTRNLVLTAILLAVALLGVTTPGIGAAPVIFQCFAVGTVVAALAAYALVPLGFSLRGKVA